MADDVKYDCIVDPESGNIVRFTDNGAKEDDFVPMYQGQDELLLDPAGMPYQMMPELLERGYAYDPGDEE